VGRRADRLTVLLLRELASALGLPALVAEHLIDPAIRPYCGATKYAMGSLYQLYQLRRPSGAS
jgi:hypothetical protein